MTCATRSGVSLKYDDSRAGITPATLIPWRLNSSRPGIGLTPAHRSGKIGAAEQHRRGAERG